MRFFDRSLQDVRFAMRSMKRSPGFFGIAVLVLALGIGMSTAIITVLHTVVLRDLPVPNPDDLVVLYAEDLSRGFDHVPLLHSMFEEYAGAARVFESVAGLQYAGAWPLDFKDGDRVIRATGVLVTGDFFETLGGRATQGRTLQRSDYDLGAEPTIVISHAMWERDFTADPSVVGRRLQLVFSDHLVLTVVGVMPPAFNLPGGADYWIPLAATHGSSPEALARRGIDVIGRLGPGGTEAAALEEYERYFRTQTISTDWYQFDGVSHPLMESEVGAIRPALLIVSAAAALLLLIACFNIATLFLMRNSRRGHELYVRSALGASRGRIAGQLLTEGLLVALLGGVLGLLMVGPILQTFIAIAPAGLPRVGDIGLNAVSLVIGVGITALVAVLSGAVPALTVTSGRRATLLRGAPGRATGSRRGVRARRALVATQFGLTLVVLTASGLVVKSLLRLQDLDPGFRPDDVMFVELAGPIDRIGPLETTRRFFDRLIPSLEARPGIERATAVLSGPFSGSGGYDARFIAEGQTPEESESNPWLNLEVVTPGYFEAFGIPVRAGRLIDGSDREGAPPSVVISESAGAQIWPGGDLIGRRIRGARSDGPWYTVIGVVSETRYREYREPRPSIYFPAAQSPYPFHPTRLAVRTSGPPANAVSTIRQVVAETDPEILVAVVSPMNQLMESPLAQPRLNVLLLGAFALTALVLTTVGLYGILGFAVRQRRRELGIRQAVGASAGDVARVILKEGMTVALVGTAVGVALSLALGRTLSAVLFEVSPADPWTLVSISGFLVLVAVGASYFPARQAGRTDPNDLLRSE